ncbi:glycosyltransferase family 2 protein [Pararhizobium sp. LjRoot255]|uniref:glycosyltransferase family 2 protein n=1 Tax=Pararhizobium sp. LjRoot255 TaxID=3342298 RepID=UPI003F5095DF
MLVTEQSPAVTSPTAGRHAASRAMRPGRVIGCRIDETTLLIIGLGRVTAGNAVVVIGDDHADTRSAFVSEWRLAAPSPRARHGFAALLPTRDTHPAITTIRFGEEETGAQFIFAPRLASAEEAAALVLESAGSQSAAVIDGLVDVLMAGNITRHRLLTITALLQAAHASDGFVEMIGESHDGVTFLQGWSRGMAPGPCRVSVVGDATPMVAECGIAVFPRPDAPDGASGFVGLLDANRATRALDIEGLVFRARAGWRHTAVHPKKRIAGPLETPEHIRSILLRTHGSPDVLLSLRAVANSFEGKETVSSLPYPVRMGIDNAFEADGGNLLASGWLYDPDSHVAMVRLRRNNAAARLDECWTRFDRPDVTDSFNEQQHFAPSLRGEQHTHGFIAQAQLPSDDPDAPLYFELTLRDLRRAFLPVKPKRVSARSATLHQMGAIDPANCALPAIVDAQIVPFLRKSGRSVPVIDTIQDVGSFDEESSPPIVIGAGESEEDIAPLLALLALDPETRCAPIVIAMPAERFRRQTTRIRELARFYRLSVRLVSVKGTGDGCDMLEAGTQALTCETVVSLSALLIPHGTGWYGKLVATTATLKGSVVSPVLAYEDHSIRWAGSWIEEDNGDQPVVGRYTGYPLKAVTDMTLTRIAAASLECCIMPRNALARAGGFSGGYLGAQEKGLDLGLRLSRSGIDSYLLPSVQMWGCDDARDGDGPAMTALVEEIDRKIFKSQWAPVLAVEKHPEKRSA